MSTTKNPVANAMGTVQVTEKRKPVFTKVDQLKPGTGGHTLTLKVVSSNAVSQKGRSASQPLRRTRIAECLVIDETGSIVFTARNDQDGSIQPFPSYFRYADPRY